MENSSDLNPPRFYVRPDKEAINQANVHDREYNNYAVTCCVNSTEADMIAGLLNSLPIPPTDTNEYRALTARVISLVKRTPSFGRAFDQGVNLAFSQGNDVNPAPALYKDPMMNGFVQVGIMAGQQLISKVFPEIQVPNG